MPKGAFYFKLLRSAVLIFFIPLMVLCVAFTAVFYHEESIANQEKTFHQMELAAEELSRQIETLSLFSGLLADNANVEKASASHDQLHYNPIELQAFLTSVSRVNPLIDDVYLYFPSDRWVFTKSRRILTRFYTDSTLSALADHPNIQLNGQPYEEVILNAAHWRRLLPVDETIIGEPTRRVLYYSQPIYRKNGEVVLLSTLRIRPQSLLDVFTGYGSEEHMPLLVLLSDGEALYASETISDAELQQIVDCGPRSTISFRGESSYLYRQLLGDLGLECVQIQSSTFLPDDFNMKLLFFSVALLAILLLGLALMIKTTRENYAHVFHVYNAAEAYLRLAPGSAPAAPAPEEGRPDELQTIRMVMNDMSSKIEALNDHKSKYINAVENEFWRDVINKRITRDQEFNERAREFGLRKMPVQWSLWVIENMPDAESAQNVLLRVSQARQDILRIFLLSEGVRHPSLVCIIGYDSPQEERYEALFKDVFSQLYEAEKRVILGVSLLKKAWSEMNDAYCQAHASVDFSHMTGKSMVYFASIDDHLLSDQHFMMDVTGAYAAALRKNDMLALNECLSSIEQMIVNNPCPLYNLRRVFFSLYTLAVEILNEAGNKTLPLTTSRLLDEIVDIQTHEASIDFLERLEQLIQKCANTQQETQMAEILSIIDREYCAPSFSFSQIAEKAKMSNSTFSRVFQKHTGKSPLEYLTEKRIEQAKRLLEKTGDPILTIAEKCGYYSVPSFTKRFKEWVGVTPRDYRAARRDAAAPEKPV